MTTYRYTISGQSHPCASATQIRYCFDTCSDADKKRLNDWLCSGDYEITFLFDEQRVTLHNEDLEQRVLDAIKDGQNTWHYITLRTGINKIEAGHILATLCNRGIIDLKEMGEWVIK